jgi:hypothetical protein
LLGIFLLACERRELRLEPAVATDGRIDARSHCDDRVRLIGELGRKSDVFEAIPELDERAMCLVRDRIGRGESRNRTSVSSARKRSRENGPKVDSSVD